MMLSQETRELEIIMTCVGNFLYSISGLGSAAHMHTDSIQP